jgi:hypothetical protein
VWSRVSFGNGGAGKMGVRLTVINGLTLFPALTNERTGRKICSREHAEDDRPYLVREIAEWIASGDPLAEAIIVHIHRDQRVCQ